MVRPSFVKGDLVFAKVKGYPAWPARITQQINAAKFRVFFYGTYEHADIKKAELWPYNQENKDKFGPPNLKRKGYADGLDQIANNPELAVVEEDNNVPPVTEGSQSEGSPPAINKGVKRSLAETESEQGKSPVVAKSAKKESEEPAETVTTPNTVSRSGRVIKPKKFGDDSGKNSNITNNKVDKIIEEPRKVWVKLKSSGDLVEINLDRDKPERWENNAQKIQWELATARNALKLKEQVEGGKYIPEEVRKKLEGQTDLTEEDKEIFRRSAVLMKRRKKIGFLKTEATMVELDRNIKTSLNNSNPQISKCCELLTEFLQISLEPLHLIKQPDILLTIRKLRKYVGPADKSNYTEADRVNIANGVKMITTRSNLCYEKLSNLFPSFSSSQKSFHEFFQDKVDKFGEETKDWEEKKLLSLTENYFDFITDC